jgi:hypothetical protein
MRLEVELAPDPADRGLGQAGPPGHRGPGPVRGILRHLLQRRGDDLFHLVQQDRRRPARPGLVAQPVQPAGQEPVPPPRHRRLPHPQLRRDHLIVPALRAGQHDLGPQRQRLRGLRPPRPPHQLVPLRIRQHQLSLGPPRPPAVFQPGQPVSGEPPPPVPDRRQGDPHGLGDARINRPRLRARQHNPRPYCHPVPALGPPLQDRAVIITQLDLNGRRPVMSHPETIPITT